MQKSTRPIPRLDRLLLALYLLALLGLLVLPISGTGRFISMGGDKFVHFALFGGLSILLRWNLAGSNNAVFKTFAAAFVIVIGTELAQSLIAYRSAELWDVVAGFAGTILGAAGMNRFMLSSSRVRLVGIFVAILGLMVGVLFVLADAIGVGANNEFGPMQSAGAALGTLILVGGVLIYLRG